MGIFSVALAVNFPTFSLVYWPNYVLLSNLN